MGAPEWRSNPTSSPAVTRERTCTTPTYFMAFVRALSQPRCQSADDSESPCLPHQPGGEGRGPAQPPTPTPPPPPLTPPLPSPSCAPSLCGGLLACRDRARPPFRLPVHACGLPHRRARGRGARLERESHRAPRARALTKKSSARLALQILLSSALCAGADRVTPPCAWPPPAEAGGFLTLK